AVVMGDLRSPDIVWIDPTIIKYWEMRMTTAKHPQLRARYADLVWDLSKAACGLKPPIDAARIAIDGHIACGPLSCAKNAMQVSNHLQRGMKLALSIGDQARAEQARDAAVKMFTQINQTWGWVTLYDLFEESSKVKLT